ncbi:MAG: hypothetical protein JW900_04770 [Anaerolineae bacterium]|nr:hypothetical protein [Anaerolineae bacterium]
MDDWKTLGRVQASYQEYRSSVNLLSGACEVWKFSTDSGSDAPKIEFAIACTVNGVTHWDNNFWKNYTLMNGRLYGDLYGGY